MKKIIATILAALTLTGCTVNAEKPVVNASDIINSVVQNNTATTPAESKPVDEVTSTDETSTTESTGSTPSVETPAASTTTSTVETPVESKPAETTSKVENKPETSKPASTTTSKVEPPASSTTTSKPSTPAASTKPAESTQKPSSTSSTPASSSKPAESTKPSTPTEKPAETSKHNCATDGHIWKVTTETTSPLWYEERHDVTDDGFDVTLAEKYFNANTDLALVYEDNARSLGHEPLCGSATLAVEVWATVTYAHKTCTECGYYIHDGIGTVNPIGEYRLKNGVNPWFKNDADLNTSEHNFNTLFWDPYNIPQVVLDTLDYFWATLLD